MISALLFLNLPLIVAATDLQSQCNQPLSTYFGSSCLILHTEQKKFNTAKIACNDILGYSGHLVHIRSPDYQPVIESLMSTGSVSNAWIGTECYGTCTTASNAGWYYTTPTKRYEEGATFIAWSGIGMTGNSLIWQMGQKSVATDPRDNSSYVCEYEEKYAYTITAAAKYCNSNPPNAPSNFASAYVDGSCLIMGDYAASLSKLRSSCKNVSGLVSRNAHLTTSAKRNIVHSFGRAFAESYYNYSTANLNDYTLATGLEQLKGCPDNTCSEEGSYSWFWTTPEGYKWPAKTQESDFWGTSQPTSSSATDYAYLSGKSDGHVDCNATKISKIGLMCEYIDPYSFTDFEKTCLLSSNPSATGYSSCFTLNRIATTFDTAKGKCTEFPGGFLARVNTVEMGTFLSTVLWAKTGLPPTMPLYTGLRRDGTQWYWMYPDGTKSAANVSKLPWDAGQPLTGDCAVLGQNGLLKTNPCTTNQWYLCQYRNRLYEFLRGTANLKASSSVAINEMYDFTYRQCRQACENYGECTSFSYSSSNKTCQMISGNSKATVAASGFTWSLLGP
uniref:Uncharacterized protein n=1 Tax=Plectus sambesii TaxID=2011161 RepID=A0A914UXA8_9BILA